MPPPRWQQICAWALLVLALTGMAATVVVWQADAAARQQHWKQALWWRPGVPSYHRELGESLLLLQPRSAEHQLERALQLDPFDPVALADLTTVQLTLGDWPQAFASNLRLHHQPGFTNYWRLANLYLAHGNPEGFWMATGEAAAAAPEGAFPSLVSRALTASDFDFAKLRGALPPASPAAAAAFLDAAVAQRDRRWARAGADWLLGLRTRPTAVVRQASQQALLALLRADWRDWSADAGGDMQRMAAGGWLPRILASEPPAAVRNGSFDPAREASLRAWAADPAGDLRAILGWQWPAHTGMQADPVLTGDATHPTAAELVFDGTQPDSLAAAQQWLLLSAGARLAVVVWTRKLDEAEARGLSLRLQARAGAPLASLELVPEAHWQATRTEWQLPPTLSGASVLSLHYQRPAGVMPLANHILVTISLSGESRRQ